MQRVRSRRGNLRVRASRRQSPPRKFRVVVRMNQVVSDTWVLGILLEQRLENFRRMLLIRAAAVSRGGRRQQRERVENLRFAVIGILMRNG